MSDFSAEVARGERFQFGKNWTKYLVALNDERIQGADASFRRILGIDSFAGKTFLDVGSGSGLFSLVARRFGANVTSFDYDPDSVACTRKVKADYFPNDNSWNVLEGSVLDAGFLSSLGRFDIVYSWGVLHHTGQMWQAIANVLPLVNEGGILFIMIYRDLGWKSRVWKTVKRTYCSGTLGRAAVVGTFVPYYVLRGLIEDVVRLKNPTTRYRTARVRGMSVYRDWIDWLGGYPYEYATPEEVTEFCTRQGFHLVKHDNHEYVFQRDDHQGERK